MKRPAFQFYPADWRNNAKLRRCTFAERGIWLEAICLMHDSDEYGVLRWTLREIAQAIGCRLSDLKSLMARDVLKGADPGQRCAACVFTPMHAGKAGEPVTLIPEQDGPIWYSSRMVRDEYLRQRRGGDTKFTAGNQPNRLPKGGIGDGEALNQRGGLVDDFASPKGGIGNGASSSSSLVPPISPASGGNGKVKRGRQRLPATVCPNSFEVTPEMSTWAQERGLPADRVMSETEKFLGYHRAKGSMFANWQQAWSNWVSKAIEYARH